MEILPRKTKQTNCEYVSIFQIAGGYYTELRAYSQKDGGDRTVQRETLYSETLCWAALLPAVLFELDRREQAETGVLPRESSFKQT